MFFVFNFQIYIGNRDRRKQPGAASLQIRYRGWRGEWSVAMCVVTIIGSMLQILDYDQYYLNLTDVIGGGPEQWQKSYSMLDYYGLKSLSVSNLSDHVYQVKKILVMWSVDVMYDCNLFYS